MLSLALAVALLGYVLPRVVGTTLHDVGAALELVTPAETVLLTVLWASGLFVYSFVLTAALPGLTRSPCAQPEPHRQRGGQRAARSAARPACR